MGYPVRNLRDVITNERKIRALKANFYTFVIYKEEHTEFREFMQKNFNKLHELSSNSGVILFIIDFPKEWMERNDIGYYRKIQGFEYQPRLSDEEVDEVCKYFYVHQDSLPSVIIFEDLQSKNCKTISLKDMCDHNELLTFFQRLYTKDSKWIISKKIENYAVELNQTVREQSSGYNLSFPQSQFTTFGQEETILGIIKSLYEKIDSGLLQLNRIEKKVNRILEAMEVLQYDIETIKNTTRSEEEKIKLIYSKIDQKFLGLKMLLKEDVQAYEEVLKDFIVHWDILDDLSKEMLPVADYLFDQLSRLENADYSPVILQYCRSLENELLKKLFMQFTKHICNKFDDIDEFLKGDLTHEKTGHFARRIRRNKNQQPQDIKYTLGEMSRILDLVAGKNTIKESRLLQEFKSFINQNFDNSSVLSKEYLGKLRVVNEEFRNKCAHPYKLKEEDALICKEELPEDINDFLKNWKQKTL